MRRKLLWSVALSYSLLHFLVTGVLQPLRNFYGDFLASFPAWTVARLMGRLDLYRGSPSEFWGPPPIWHYGPIEHLMTLPLFAFPTLRSAYVAWLFVCYAFVAAAVVLSAWIIDDGRPSARTLLIVGIAFANFNPLYEALTQRVIELIELPLLLLSFLLYRRMRDRTSGTLIAVAAMSKFLPVVFLPWLALRERWRAFTAAVLVAASIAVITQCVLGWQNSGIVLQLIFSVLVKSDLNQSISGVLIRCTPWSDDLVARIALGIEELSWLALWLLLIQRRRANCYDLEFSILITGMVLLIPHNQQYYFVLLLIPYSLLYARCRDRWTARFLPLAVSFVALAAPVPLSLLSRMTGGNALEAYLRWSVPFAGTLLFGILLIPEYGTSCAVFEASEK